VKGLEQLYEILRGYPGNGELQLVVDLADKRRVPMNCPKFRVDINPEMRSRVDELLGPGNFRLLPAAHKPSNGNGRNGNGRGGAKRG
jgi:DNA polymerase-3 subunit alpha